jgi:hypothetical protein
MRIEIGKIIQFKLQANLERTTPIAGILMTSETLSAMLLRLT